MYIITANNLKKKVELVMQQFATPINIENKTSLFSRSKFKNLKLHICGVQQNKIWYSNSKIRYRFGFLIYYVSILHKLSPRFFSE